MTTAAKQPPSYGSEEWILSARKRLKPIPVRLHHVPRWLPRAIKASLGKPPAYYGNPWTLLDWAARQCGGASWLDHWGSANEHGQTRFVSEPYASADMVLAAIQFARKLDLHLDVSSNSFWFPGRTLRLSFGLKEGTTP